VWVAATTEAVMIQTGKHSRLDWSRCGPSHSRSLLTFSDDQSTVPNLPDTNAYQALYKDSSLSLVPTLCLSV
jgi:hypothetical protein